MVSSIALCLNLIKAIQNKGLLKQMYNKRLNRYSLNWNKQSLRINF